MPTFQEITTVIILERKNTGSKLTLKEKIKVELPISGCSVRTSVEKFTGEKFPEWFLLEYQTI